MMDIEYACAWFVCLFHGAVIFCSLLGLVSAIVDWKKNRKMELPGKSEPSDDFIEESRSVLAVIQARDESGSCGGILSKEEKAQLEKLRSSSSFASLVRYAHYAGCHLTFEQNDQEWSADPEYLDPNVFKTDMREATFLREERKLKQYKRYYDHPKSIRERMLARRNG